MLKGRFLKGHFRGKTLHLFPENKYVFLSNACYRKKTSIYLDVLHKAKVYFKYIQFPNVLKATFNTWQPT